MKYNFSQVKEEIESQNYSINPSYNPENYKNSGSKIDLVCPNKHEWSCSFSNFFKNNRRCKKCSIGTRSTKRRKSKKEIEDVFLKVGFTLLDDYSNYKNKDSKLKVMCESGHIHYSSYAIASQGCGCPYCNQKIKHTIEEVRDLFSNRGYILISDKYVDAHGKLEFICEKHKELNQYTTFTLARQGFCNCSECYSEKKRGENSPMWDDSIPNEIRYQSRAYPEYKLWRKNVLKRDNYTCVCCNEFVGKNGNVHHLDGYNWCIERRIDIDNGVTLCSDCHLRFHSIYGFGFNTYDQFNEFLQNKLYIYKDELRCDDDFEYAI
jgi:hypothetical protein